MTSRERVAATLAHRRPDRTALDYWGRDDVTRRLMRHLGLDSREALYRRLGIDLRPATIEEVNPSFDRRTNGILGGSCAGTGRAFIFRDARTYEDAWGVVRRLGEDGLYEQWVDGPFTAGTDLDAFAWPDPDGFEPVADLRRRLAPLRESGAVLGRINLPFKDAWHMRGFENFLCDMLADPAFARALLARVAAYEREKGLRLIRAGVDIIGTYGDIAMQDRLLFPPAAWRAVEKPILADMFAAFRRENPAVRIFFHSDGNVAEAIPDLLEIGVDILNPVQPECLAPEDVKRRYGERLTLHGTISIQRTLPRGSVDDVRREVRRRIEVCGAGGGFILCPSNALQNDTPLENIVALYEEANDQ